jgi:transcriptional regulator with XRE-family HTH domain
VPTPPRYANHLILRALAQFPSQRALAERLHMTASRLTRVKNGGRLSVESCLWLADVLSEDPAVVLRAYGYKDEAAILDRAYPGRGRRPQGDVSLLRDVEKLSPERLRLVRELITALTPKRKRR